MKSKYYITTVILSLATIISFSCNKIGITSNIVGSYSLKENGESDFEISKINGTYTLKLGRDESFDLSTPSESDCKEKIGNDYKDILIQSYYSPRGLYFFEVKKGSVIHGEVNKSGYYFLTYIAGQAWKVK